MRQSVVVGGTSQNVYRDQHQLAQDAQASSNNLLNKGAAAQGQMKVNKRTASLKEGSLNGVNYQIIQGAPQPQLKTNNMNQR